MANITQVKQEADWAAIESNPTPVLVDFWAEWCGPCRMLAPTVDRLAEAYNGRVGFAKVNVDDVPAVASRFGIRSIPTLVLLRQGKVIQQLVGLRSYEELAKVLDQHAIQVSH